ncbi:uncharacterized protein [Hetaerina americana]|uniref:uncharacterized protein n=1 Tax=Hetaerina americana TaxID=62018 RepID=UPI003A7F111A
MASHGGFKEEITETGAHRCGQTTLFPLFTVVRFANSPCLGTNNLAGICYSRRECQLNGGVGFGTCANGIGVCCVVALSCGTTSNFNCTYFTNPGYPGSYTGGDRCTIAISKCNTNVCQLRLDFRNFNLQGPDANGNCVNDFFQVSGAASPIPRICGTNTGEHMYIDFPAGTNPITLSITANNLITAGRTWSIKATQITCDSPLRAPPGCLMYFTSTTGQIKSFNYAATANTAAGVTLAGTREMTNLNYGVCVQMAAGYCSITWSQNPSDPYSFTVTGDTDGLDTTILGTAAAAVSGAACNTDFIVIPRPSQNGLLLSTDRFCGNALVPTTTSSKPFVLTVVTNGDELAVAPNPPDSGNRGFCLNFRQMVCA